MTRKETLWMCLKLWEMLAEKGYQSKSTALKKLADKYKTFDAFTEMDWGEREIKMANHCPCCEYVNGLGGDPWSITCHKMCPVNWGILDDSIISCISKKSPYAKWEKAVRHDTHKRLAGDMVKIIKANME